MGHCWLPVNQGFVQRLLGVRWRGYWLHLPAELITSSVHVAILICAETKNDFSIFLSRESVEKTTEEAKMQIEKENEEKTLEDKVEEEEGVTAVWVSAFSWVLSTSLYKGLQDI